MVSIVRGEELLDLCDDLIGVSASKPIGQFDVTRLDCCNHCLVLIHELGWQTVVIGLVVETEQPAPVIEQAQEKALTIGMSARPRRWPCGSPGSSGSWRRHPERRRLRRMPLGVCR